MTLRSKPFRAILVTVVEVAVLLELTLQGLSWIQYLKLQHAYDAQLRAARLAANTILCVGDSFTFGIGASSQDHSYPAQLQQWLNTRTPSQPWTVLNFGKPGQNSWQVTHALEQWLRLTKPRYTCVLVGANDTWNPIGTAPHTVSAFPPELTGAPLIEWRWKYRTGVLLTLLIRQARGNLWLGSRAVRHHTRPPRTDEQAGLPRTSTVKEQTVEELFRAGDRMLYTDKNYAQAEQIFTEVLSKQPDHAWARLRLARAQWARGKQRDALQRIDELQHYVSGTPDVAADFALDLAWLLTDIGDLPAARAIAEQNLQRHPDHAKTLTCLALIAMDGMRFDEADGYLNRAQALNPSSAELHAYRILFRDKTHMFNENTKEDYQDLIRYYELSHDVEQTSQYLGLLIRDDPIDGAAFKRLLLTSTLDASGRTALGTLFEELSQQRWGYEAGLEKNLQEIAQLCQRYHSHLMILNYPWDPDHEVNVALKRIVISSRSSWEFVDVAAHLSHLRAGRHLPYGYFLVKDGHANNAGYAEMARFVAAHVLESEVKGRRSTTHTHGAGRANGSTTIPAR